MATINAHGGACCGMRHIYTFRDTDAQNVAELRRLTLADNMGEGRYNLEVILSNRQTEQNPMLMAELARLGYTYTTAFSGQHGTPVHVFHRAKHRLALNAIGNRWQGMVVNAGLAGDLPAIRTIQAPVAPAQPNQPYAFEVGSRVQIRPGTPADHHNASIPDGGFMINRFDHTPAGSRRAYFYDRYARLINIVCDNLESFRAVGPLVDPEQEPLRHPVITDGNVTVRHTEWFAVFADGRERGPFGNIARLREAYHRVRRMLRRDIMSNGDINRHPIQDLER